MLRISVASVLAGLHVQGARVSKRSELKTIAGVEIRNYREGVDKWVLMFAEGTTKDQIRRTCGGECDLEGSPDDGGFAWASVSGTTTVEKMLTTRRGSTGLQYIFQDVWDHAIPEIVDNSSSVASASPWGLARVGADDPLASGSGVHIYIQDTGIRTTHLEFGGRASSQYDITSGLATPCSGSGGCAEDRQGHGTHCAGTAGGKSFGVAPGANIYAVKTLGDDGRGQRSWQFAGIEHVTAVGKRPAVLSMSLGGSGTENAYEDAFKAAVQKNVVVVVAAGNDNSNACNFSPAFAESAITVGSTTVTNARSWFSNWGECVNIMAPGSDVLSAGIDSDSATNTFSGTSMACPHVAGGAAILLQKSPDASALTIRTQLTSRARQGFISNLRGDDPEVFLWVGAGSAPISAPTTAPPPTPPSPKCPSFAKSEEPDSDGDCKCQNGHYCSLNEVDRNCPTSAGDGGWGGTYFLPTCTDCRCISYYR